MDTPPVKKTYKPPESQAYIVNQQNKTKINLDYISQLNSCFDGTETDRKKGVTCINIQLEILKNKLLIAKRKKTNLFLFIHNSISHST